MTRSYSFRNRSRRQGQALLLAVLIMIFAALIGVTFITVVAVNIGQTGREEERGKAYQAAQAGLAFANLQITNGTDGLRWRPEKEVNNGTTDGPPDAGNVFYWTPFDNAQGWAGYNGSCDTAGDPCEGNFVKFPDPRSTNSSDNAPNYMIKVEKVGTDPVKDADNALKDKTGMLRITSIGLSPDDPTSFYQTIAYKAGPAQSPFTGAMRSVSNWDFQNGVVPSGRVVSYTAATPSYLVIEGVSGRLPEAPFYITVGGFNFSTGAITPIRGQAVSAVEADTPSVGQWRLTLPTQLQPTGGSVTAGDRVEVAAAIGGPETLDLNNNNAIDTSRESVTFDVSDAAATTPGSVWTNGGLLWFGTVQSGALNAPQNGGVPGFIRTSGVMRRFGAATPSSTVAVAGTTTGGAFTGSLGVDSAATFPGTFSGAGASQVGEVIDDGMNRLQGSPASSRQVKPFTPPDITIGGSGFGRYRQMTKYSPSTDSANPQGGAYGFGRDGIYINNPEDKEKISVSGGLKEMTQAELRNMWFSGDVTSAPIYYRRGTPAKASEPDKSLEEQHLRGWVGPEEFRARGALVEILADNPNTPLISSDPAIQVTLDPRADNTTTDTTRSLGPVPDKGWRNADGTRAGDAALGGVYSRIYEWPEKGVIFAEGNIRIRGELTAAPRSLTVVSMNNIYIEDSVGLGDDQKLVLLARKNVVLNPTRVVGRIDYQTRMRADANAGDTTLQVQDATSFKQGDWITIDTPTANDAPLCVESASGTTITLYASTPVVKSDPTVSFVGLPIRTKTDPVDESSTTPYTNYANLLSRFAQTLQRRIPNDGAASLRIALRHSSERRAKTTEPRALTIKVEQADLGYTPALPALEEASLENKLVANREDGVILPAVGSNPTQKLFKVHYKDTDTPNGIHQFFPPPPPPGPADDVAALLLKAVDNNGDVNDDIKHYLESRNSIPQEWHYTVDDPKGYGMLPTPPAYFFLAAVGNRYEASRTDAPPSPTAFPYRKTLYDGTTSTAYTIPMANSVQLTVNGLDGPVANPTIPATITSDHWSGGSGAMEAVKQFGFNFLFGATNNTFEYWEDVLTVDQSFYRSGYGPANDKDVTGDADNTYYTLDSRTLSDFPSAAVVPTAFPSRTLAFRFDPRAKGYFSSTDGDTPRIPYYRLSRLKMEDETFDDTTHDLTGLKPGHTFNVNAYVYAQEGSWNIIPGIFFDENVKRDWVDLPPYTSPLNHKDDGENLDLNRDGTTSEAEKAAVYRFYRYNYKINFKGAIMENKSAPVIDAGTSNVATQILGDVKDWTNKWISVTLTAANFPSGTLDHDSIKFGNEWKAIGYEFDPAAAANALNADEGFNPPISPDLIYQTG